MEFGFGIGIGSWNVQLESGIVIGIWNLELKFGIGIWKWKLWKPEIVGNVSFGKRKSKCVYLSVSNEIKLWH